MEDARPTIIDALDTLRKRDLSEKQPFRARAYATAIAQLRGLDRPVRTMDDIRGLKGIGEKITEKIREILATGSLAAAVKAKEVYSTDALDAFQGIYGIGPAKARELVQRGLKTVAQLRAAVEDDPAVLNDKQRVGLRYYEDLLQRIPREEMLQHELLLRELLPASMTDYHTDIVGSFRRGALNSGDIDLLVRMPPGTTPSTVKSQLATYVMRLRRAGYLEEVLAIGEHKCMAICRIAPNACARRLDILMTPDEEYVYSLFYFTGSDRFNVAIRQFCQQQGYTLNEHTLTPLHANRMAPPHMETEEDLFAFLCLIYVPPEERVDGRQVVLDD
jgi:DNA polymerase beta